MEAFELILPDILAAEATWDEKEDEVPEVQTRADVVPCSARDGLDAGDDAFGRRRRVI